MKAMVALAAAGVLVVGGVAAAATGVLGDGGTIEACVASNGGLSVAPAKGCKKNEDALSWNQVGPQGPAGPQGEPGTPGTPGAPGAQGGRGPSDAWSASLPETAFADTDNGGPLDEVAFTLPAGSYVLSGSIDLENTWDSRDDLRCSVQVDGDKGARTLVPRTRVLVEPFGEDVIPLAGAATLAATADVHVRCAALSPNGGKATATVQLTAIQVGALHE
jgi:hypothetical protein